MTHRSIQRRCAKPGSWWALERTSRKWWNMRKSTDGTWISTSSHPTASRLLLQEIAGMVRSQVKPKVMFWRCVGIGCTIGLRRMMRISRAINESELEHTVNWHFSLDGLQAGSDRVLRLTDRLELPNLSRRSRNRLHTSSDGQKFEVRVDSLNVNYSFKYFGKEHGVSLYTFRDERDLLSVLRPGVRSKDANRRSAEVRERAISST